VMNGHVRREATTLEAVLEADQAARLAARAAIQRSATFGVESSAA